MCCVVNLYRDIEILRYSGGKIHIPYVTTSKGVDLIREAKKNNLDITASVSLAHITFSEKDIPEFDTNYKFDIRLEQIKLVPGTNYY